MTSIENYYDNRSISKSVHILMEFSSKFKFIIIVVMMAALDKSWSRTKMIDSIGGKLFYVCEIFEVYGSIVCITSVNSMCFISILSL